MSSSHNIIFYIERQLADNSNKMFRNLKTKESITEKELKYFTIEFKKATNLGKLYLLKFINVWKMFQLGPLFQTVALH